MNDRQVHARSINGIEVVRYDRSGKWYIEQNGPDERFRGITVSYHERAHIKISEAVSIAKDFGKNGGEVFLGLPGGKTFDSKMGR